MYVRLCGKFTNASSANIQLEVSSAFYMHPTIASTPVPEGVTVRFSPTAVNGYAGVTVMPLRQNPKSVVR